MTIEVRRARAGDEDALVELRAEMFRAMGLTDHHNGWRQNARAWFMERLDDPCYGIFVAADGPRVVACAVGMVRDAAPSPSSPTGGDVLISNVCTLPERRRLGYGRAAFDAVMEWARGQGAGPS